jgi:hypothetical protein
MSVQVIQTKERPGFLLNGWGYWKHVFWVVWGVDILLDMTTSFILLKGAIHL